MTAWAGTYFDHYEKFFNKASSREVFEIDGFDRKVQILAYKNVYSGCITFASIGLASFSPVIGTVAELIVTVDDGWDDISKIIAETINYIVNKPMRIGWGLSVSGEKNISPLFAEKYNKDALYVTHPMGLPGEFYSVVKPKSNIVGEIYMGVFISSQENELFKKIGAEKFEKIMEESNVDPFHVSRNSIV